jgi:hypothetical protein
MTARRKRTNGRRDLRSLIWQLTVFATGRWNFTSSILSTATTFAFWTRRNLSCTRSYGSWTVTTGRTVRLRVGTQQLSAVAYITQVCQSRVYGTWRPPPCRIVSANRQVKLASAYLSLPALDRHEPDPVPEPWPPRLGGGRSERNYTTTGIHGWLRPGASSCKIATPWTPVSSIGLSYLPRLITNKIQSPTWFKLLSPIPSS